MTLFNLSHASFPSHPYFKVNEDKANLAPSSCYVYMGDSDDRASYITPKFVSCTLKEVKENNLDAQFNLGVIYEMGLGGVKQDFGKAYFWYLKAAKQGNENAQDNLGSLYLYGKGTQKNIQKAIYWYKKASEQGSTTASYNLGVAYRTIGDYKKAMHYNQISAKQGAIGYYGIGFLYSGGLGVEKNEQKAAKYYLKAAEADVTEAQFAMGLYYRLFQTPPDYEKALYWFRLASDKGDADAMGNLGVMYDLGLGVKEDTSEALRLFLKASDLGSGHAAQNLGIFYEDGHGVTKDLKQACYWYQLAITRGPLEDTLAQDSYEKLSCSDYPQN